MTENNIQTAPKPQTLQQLISSPAIMSKLNGCLGNEKKASAFVSSVISIANGNNYLRKANPMSVIGAAMVAATLDLPIVPTLGFAYIIPYGTSAQFQIGYKGILELAMRSGEFKNIIDEVVYEGQLISANKFTGEYDFDENKKTSDRMIGVMARFDLINGFSKTVYWTKEEIDAHAKKFSQAFRGGRNTPWTTDYESMAKKTVLKNLLAKYAPKSTAMQTAITFDQSRVNTNTDNVEDIDVDIFTPEYVDNEPQTAEAVEIEVDAKQSMKKEDKK